MNFLKSVIRPSLWTASIGLSAMAHAAVDPVNDSTPEVVVYPFRIFVPPDIGVDEKLPLIVFLEGAGDGGTDNVTQVTRHVGPMLEVTQEPGGPYRSIVAVPQSPSGWWGGFFVNEMVDYIEQHYPVDRSREYLSGLSAGGGGCYVTIAADPARWAATVPQSAVRDAASIPYLPQVPMWLVHGDADNTVGLSASQQVYNEVTALGGTPRLTVVPGWAHGPWTAVLEGDSDYMDSYIGGTSDNTVTGFYAWLFSNQLDEVRSSTRELQAGDHLLFDFGHYARLADSPDGDGQYWNVVMEFAWDHDLYVAPRTIDGEEVAMRVRYAKVFTGYAQDGSGDASGLYQFNAQSDYVYAGNLRGHSTALDYEGIVEFYELDPALRYDLSLFGSLAGGDGTNGVLTRYTVNGVSQDLDAADNLTRTVEFLNVAPDAEGKISISVAVSPDGTARYAPLSVVEITTHAASTRTWSGREVDENGIVDTGAWLGRLFLLDGSNWAYAYAVSGWIWLEEPEPGANAWVYFAN